MEFVRKILRRVRTKLWGKRDPAQIIDKFVEKLRTTDAKVNSIIIYGSSVSGGYTPASDIDVAVFPSPLGTAVWDTKTLMEMGGIAKKIIRTYEPPLEIVPRSIEEFKFDTSTLMSTEFRETALQTAVEYLIKGTEEILPKLREAIDPRPYDRQRENVERSCFFKRMTMRQKMVYFLHMPKKSTKNETRNSISWSKKIIRYSAAYLDEGAENPYSHYHKLDNAIKFFENRFPELRVGDFMGVVKERSENWYEIQEYPRKELAGIYGAGLNFVEKIWVATLCEKYKLPEYIAVRV